MKGYVYLGRATNVPDHTYIFLFSNRGYLIAYLWVEKHGKTLNLPICEAVSPNGFIRPGYNGAVLSGDVYTNNKVLPNGDLVITHCPAKEWTLKLD